jgi:hypothetical protein
VALIATVALAGCSSQAVIDHKKAEALVRGLAKSNHAKLLVRCPSGVVARKGATFECAVTNATGSPATVTVHVLNASGSLTIGLEDLHLPPAVSGSGLALLTPVSFRNIPQLRPSVSVVVVPGRPIDPGSAQDGSTTGSFPPAQLWPGSSTVLSSQLVQARFVNLPVTVTNVGRAPVRIKIEVGATDSEGRETNSILRDDLRWPGPHGREPDWTSRQSEPIAPGVIVTRYLTFAIARSERIVQFSISANLLYHGETGLRPEIVTFRGP